MRFQRIAMLCAVSAIGLSCGNLAKAADAPAPVAAPGDATTPEIIVTAEKRSGTLQSVPIALVAVTAQALKEQHVTETSDLASVVPNLQIVPISQTIQINIRGVGSNFFDPRAESSVSQSIDGLYYARPPQAGGTFFDLSRVEVLKGPQGTLYGTNAAAGALNLVTNHPSDHFEASAEIGFGNYAEREYGAMINVPLSDTFAIRVAGKGFHHDGYLADYYDDAADDAFRTSAQWKPGDKLTVYAAYNFSNFSGNGTAPVSYPCDTTPYSNTISAACAPPGAPGGTYALTGKTKSRMQTSQLNIDYDLGFGTLTSVTGYMTQYVVVDKVPNGTFFVSSLDQRSHDFSEEVRLAGKANGHHQGELGWVVGGYYSKGNGSQTFVGLGTQIETALPQTIYAGFAQLTYGITDQIRATAGGRYTHYTKGAQDNIGSDISFSDGRANYRAAIEADLAPHNMVYASVSSGFVAGGVDAGVVGAPLPPGVIPPTFQPETITSYELGSKNTFLGGKLRVNLDLYYYTIKQYQSYDPGFIDTFAGGPALQLQNIGDVKTYGAEIDGAFAATPQDRFTFSGSLAHGTFGTISLDSFSFVGGPHPVFETVPSGYPLTNLPHWDVRMGYFHTFDLANDAHIDAAINTHVSGAYWTVPASTDNYDRQGSYIMSDASLTYTSTKGFTASAWIKNMENKVINTYGENPGFHLYYPAAPRTFGGTIGVKF